MLSGRKDDKSQAGRGQVQLAVFQKLLQGFKRGNVFPETLSGHIMRTRVSQANVFSF